MDTTTLIPAGAQQAATTTASQAQQALEVAEAYVVDSQEMYALAGDELRNIATRKAKLEETRMGITRPMDAAKKAVMDLFRGPLEVLEKAEGHLRGSMLTWKKAEDERARKAQAEAEAQARAEAAERERKRKEAEAAEAAARAEADKALADGDQEAFTKAAEVAEAAAAVREEVEVAQDLADVAPVYAPTVAAPAAAGVSSRQNWKAEVTDLHALVKAAAEKPELLAYLVANTTALNGMAKALKGAARIPGVRVYADESLAVRRR